MERAIEFFKDEKFVKIIEDSDQIILTCGNIGESYGQGVWIEFELSEFAEISRELNRFLRSIKEK